MKNMVWKYCRSISPEWKHQVRRAGSGVWTGRGSGRMWAPLGECWPGRSTLVPGGSMASDGSWALFGLVYETKVGMDFGWQIRLVFSASTTGLVGAPQSPGLKRPRVQSDQW